VSLQASQKPVLRRLIIVIGTLIIGSALVMAWLRSVTLVEEQGFHLTLVDRLDAAWRIGWSKVRGQPISWDMGQNAR
jgi:hypothetical protein